MNRPRKSFSQLCEEFKATSPHGPTVHGYVESLEYLVDSLTETSGQEGEGTDEPDSINHPSHYTAGDIECIDAIHAALGDVGYADFLRGQVIKYSWRMPHKGQSVEDAGKLAWYAERLRELEAANP